MSKQKPTTQAVVKSADSQVELFQERPDWLQGQQRGSEHVTIEDMLVPRIELVQPLSPCKDEDDDAYIEGAKDGMLFNTVSRELYGKAVTIVPVFYRKSYLLFRTRKAGGGFRGSFDTAQGAESGRAALEDPSNHEVVEAGEHFVLIVGSSSVQQGMLTCTKTKLKTSRQLNSLVRMRGEDRWASGYELSSVKQTNDKGTFYNYAVRPLGFVSERIYREGERLWQSLASGARQVRADLSDLDATPQVDDGM